MQHVQLILSSLSASSTLHCLHCIVLLCLLVTSELTTLESYTLFALLTTKVLINEQLSTLFMYAGQNVTVTVGVVHWSAHLTNSTTHNGTARYDSACSQNEPRSVIICSWLFRLIICVQLCVYLHGSCLSFLTSPAQLSSWQSPKTSAVAESNNCTGLIVRAGNVHVRLG